MRIWFDPASAAVAGIFGLRPQQQQAAQTGQPIDNDPTGKLAALRRSGNGSGTIFGGDAAARTLGSLFGSSGGRPSLLGNTG